MKKFAVVVLFLLTFAGIACAEVKIDLDEFKCVVCDENFFAFKGDNLDKIRENEQPGKVFLLSDRGKNPKECKNGVKTHRYDKRGTRNVNIELIAQNMSRILVVKSGGTLSQKLIKWKCLLCGKSFYSFSGVNLNIKDWDEQPSHIKCLRGMSGIQQCSARSEGYFGHVFKQSEEGPMRSYDFANSSVRDYTYFVK